MGCVLSCVACCFCNAAASLCCSCMPSCRASTSSRLVYGVILLVVLFFSSLCLCPEVEKLLRRVPSLCPGGPDDLCELITGYGSAYRLCFALSLFFFVFYLVMINVRSSRDFRAAIHNGFWFFKILALLGIMVGAFYIRDPRFLYVWMVFGMIGACLYIVLQLILLVDFAHSWNEKWTSGYSGTGRRIYLCGLTFFTTFFFAVSITAAVLFCVYFASGPSCNLGKMLVTINSIFCIISSVISIIPAVQDKMPSSGLLQSSVISAYIMYLTWSALVNIPSVECNPTLRTVNTTITVDGIQTVVVTADPNFGVQTGVSLVILILSVIYASIRTSSHNSVGRLTMAPTLISGGVDTSDAAEAGGNVEATKRGGQTVWDNEKDGVAYSYAMFHLMMLLATLFVMMSITNWYRPDKHTALLSANHASFWIKAASSWVCAAIYDWTLLAPVIFPNRDFT